MRIGQRWKILGFLGFCKFSTEFILIDGVLWQDLFAIAQDQPFRFPSTFTFVIRAFSTLEGLLPSLPYSFLSIGDHSLKYFYSLIYPLYIINLNSHSFVHYKMIFHLFVWIVL